MWRKQNYIYIYSLLTAVLGIMECHSWELCWGIKKGPTGAHCKGMVTRLWTWPAGDRRAFIMKCHHLSAFTLIYLGFTLISLSARHVQNVYLRKYMWANSPADFSLRVRLGWISRQVQTINDNNPHITNRPCLQRCIHSIGKSWNSPVVIRLVKSWHIRNSNSIFLCDCWICLL